LGRVELLLNAAMVTLKFFQPLPVLIMHKLVTPSKLSVRFLLNSEQVAQCRLVHT